jgi:outer membrane protein
MMRMLVFLLLVALPAFAQQARILTLDEALSTARANQPLLAQAHASTEAALARADQARSQLLPQVAGGANYQRSTANFVSRPSSLPRQLQNATSTSNWDTFNFWNFDISANVLVYDFGAARSRWRAGKATAQAERQSETATLQQVVYNVRNAYFQARAARALVRVQIEAVDNQEKHLQQAEAFVEVGTKPEIDLAQARTDRANAEVQLINAQNGYEAAKAQLNQAMGVVGPTDYDVADETLPPVPNEDGPVDALFAEAVAARPEPAALTANIRAQELSLRAARGSLWPSLSFNTGFTDAGGALGSLAWNWSGALGLSIPIFQGGLAQAQIAEARWSLAGLQAQYNTLTQQVRLEVDQARLAVRAAGAALSAADQALINAREQLRLAEGRYETGVGNIIELGDAQLALTQAEQQKIQSEYQLSSARAQLLKALGRA